MPRRSAFTLVELLVVITIIGILMSLLMPSMAAMRESSRRTQCLNNLKQMATAINSHVATHGHFPTGGWGYEWAGDPDCGFGIEQPGGWIYNILPFLDMQPIYDLGRLGKSITKLTNGEWNQKFQAFEKRAEMALPLFNCPSRRACRAYMVINKGAINYTVPTRSGRSDYAANRGASQAGWGTAGSPYKSLPSATTLAQNSAASEQNADGVMFYLGLITPAHIRDGLSSTYLVGEKHLNPNNYSSGQDSADDQNLFIGDDQDIARWTYAPPLRDTDITTVRTASGGTINLSYIFGSAHAAGFQAAFCDGHVRLVSYTIDPAIHAALGTRDGVNKKNPATNAIEDPIDESKIP